MLTWRPPKIFLRITAVGAFVGGLVAFKEFLGGGNYEGKEKLDDKTVIVTGSNCGIGKETAMEMARRGGRVIMACRDVDKCKEARKDIVLETRNRKVKCMKCDLSSQVSIREFAKAVNEDEPRIDILINNAGVMRCRKSFTEEGIEMQLGVNHMGHFLLTMLLLDKLKASAPSRIINVSSVAHQRGKINFEDLNLEKSYDEGAAYNQSKLANVLFTNELAKRLEGSGVTSNSLHPGLVFTNIDRHLTFSRSWISGPILQPFMWLFLKTRRQGARTTIYLALSTELGNVSGEYFSNCAISKTSDAAKNDDDSVRLWAISERWTGLR